MVINELLCFISHKLRILPDSTVIQLSKNFYNTNTIESAKKQIFTLCGRDDVPADRYKTRKGAERNRQYLKDITDMITRKCWHPQNAVSQTSRFLLHMTWRCHHQ